MIQGVVTSRHEAVVRLRVQEALSLDFSHHRRRDTEHLSGHSAVHEFGMGHPVQGVHRLAPSKR